MVLNYFVIILKNSKLNNNFLMSKVEIIDNFLNEEDFEELRKFLMSPRSQWRFVDFIAHKDGRDNDKDGYFVHSFTDRDPNTFKERFLISPDYQKVSRLMECIKKKLNYSQILRVRSSLYPRREKQKPDPFHVDYNFNHKVCIFYVNTNNGFTLFENGEKVNSVANRLLIFEGLEKHCSVVQTDTTARYIININLLL